MPNRNDAVSRNFTYAEFFPSSMKTLPDLECSITEEFVTRTLQPLRDFIDCPIIVNNGRQAAGWRDIDEIQYGDGAAGTISDHALLDINPIATGAVDIVSTGINTEQLMLCLVAMSEAKRVLPPREAILEYRGLYSWIHVSFNEGIKKLLEFPADLAEARPPRDYDGRENRWWMIKNGYRYPMFAKLERKCRDN